MTKTAKNNLVGYLSIGPALLMISGVGIVPILITFSYSFQYRVLTDPLNTHFVGLDNYIELLTDPSFW